MNIVRMNLVFLVLAVLLFSPFLVSAEEGNAIMDKLGIMGSHDKPDSYINKAEEVIKNLRDKTNQVGGVMIRVEIRDTDYPVEDVNELKSILSDIYRLDYNMDVNGNKLYNVLIAYGTYSIEGEVEEKPFLRYIVGASCRNFFYSVYDLEDEMDITSGQPEGEEFYNAIKKLADFIDHSVKIYGEDCKTEEKELQRNDVTVSKEFVYIIDDTDWKNVLRLIPLSTYHYPSGDLESVDTIARKNHVMYSPTLVYHREGDEIDIDSIMIFLEQFNPGHVTIFYDHEDGLPEKLSRLTSDKSKWKWGTSSATSISSQAGIFMNIWNFAKKYGTRDYDSIVISEDDYKTGLMASLLASYYNSPLVFSASELENYDYYKDEYVDSGMGPSAARGANGEAETFTEEHEDEDLTEKQYTKNIYCVGNVDIADEDCHHTWTVESLQEFFKDVFVTDKAILVNPNDIKDENCEDFEYTTDFGKLTKSHCKDSLVAPILASVKNELLMFTDVDPLEEGVRFAEPEKSKNIYVDKTGNFYLLYNDRIEKVNFEKKTRKNVEIEKPDFPYIQLVPHEDKMYYMGKSGNLHKLEGDKLKRLEVLHGVYDKLREFLERENMEEQKNIDLIDYTVDNQENLYVFYRNHRMDEKFQCALVKWDKDGSKKFGKFINYGEDIPEIENKDLTGLHSLSRTKFKVNSEGIHVFFPFFKGGDMGTNRNIYHTIVYKKYDLEGNLIETRSHKVDIDEKFKMQLPHKYIYEDYDFYVDDQLNLYFHGYFDDDMYVFRIDPNSKPNQIWKEHRIETSSVKDVFVDESNDRVYTLFYTGAVGVFSRPVSPYNIVITKIANGRHECYFYQKDATLNPEKVEFEYQVNKKSDKVKEDIESQGGMVTKNYLTIISSPRAVPMSQYVKCINTTKDKGNYLDFRSSLDIQYANGKSLGKILTGKAVGRIFGITISDTSSYVARSIAFSENDYSHVPKKGKLMKFENVALMAAKFPYQQSYVPNFAKQLKGDYEVSCLIGDKMIETRECKHLFNAENTDVTFLEDKDLILYDDHGDVDHWDFLRISSDHLDNVKLNSPVTLSAACSSLNYYDSYNDELMGSNFIRRGALAHYGPVSVTIWNYIGPELFSRVVGKDKDGEITNYLNVKGREGYDLGYALISAIRDYDVYGIFKELSVNYMLLGDPTVQLALPEIVDLKYDNTRTVTRAYYCSSEDKCENEKKDVRICYKELNERTTKVEVVDNFGMSGIVIKNPLYDSVTKPLFDELRKENLWNAKNKKAFYNEFKYGLIKSKITLFYSSGTHNNPAYYYCDDDEDCDKKYCECFKDMEKCKTEMKNKILSGGTAKPKYTPPPTQDVGDSEGDDEEKENVYVCVGNKNGDILFNKNAACGCIPCDPAEDIRKSQKDLYMLKCNSGQEEGKEMKVLPFRRKDMTPEFSDTPRDIMLGEIYEGRNTDYKSVEFFYYLCILQDCKGYTKDKLGQCVFSDRPRHEEFSAEDILYMLKIPENYKG